MEAVSFFYGKNNMFAPFGEFERFLKLPQDHRNLRELNQHLLGFIRAGKQNQLLKWMPLLDPVHDPRFFNIWEPISTWISQNTQHLCLSTQQQNIQKISLGKQVQHFQLSCDGHTLLTFHEDRQLCLWNAHSGTLLRKLAHSISFQNEKIQFSPLGDSIFRFNQKLQQIQVWEAKNGNTLFNLPTPDSRYTSFVLAPDGQRFLLILEHHIQIWKKTSQNYALATTLQQAKEQIALASFAPQGHQLLTLNRGGRVRTWDVHSGESIACLRSSTAIKSAIYSPDGAYIATINEQKNRGMIKIWDAHTGNLLSSPKEQDEDCRGFVAFSPNSQYLVTTPLNGAKRSELSLWKVPEGRFVTTLKEHKKDINALAFSSTYPYLATASDDHTTLIYDLEQQQLITRLEHSSRVRKVSFSPEGTKILTTTSNGCAYLWNSRGHCLLRFEDMPSGILEAVFSPDGSYLLFRDKIGHLFLWKANS